MQQTFLKLFLMRGHTRPL